MAVDRRDWAMLGGCFTDPVHADFTEAGSVAAEFARDDLVGGISGAISGFTATQHLSPNHVIEFDADDSGRAVCYSSMFAQHYLAGGRGARSSAVTLSCCPTLCCRLGSSVAFWDGQRFSYRQVPLTRTGPQVGNLSGSSRDMDNYRDRGVTYSPWRGPRPSHGPHCGS